MSLALLILRLGCGIVFLFHGSQILFGAFGGPGPERTAASLHTPAMTGYLVGIAQIAGGLAVLTGILIRIGGNLHYGGDAGRDFKNSSSARF
jgi:putative oxidoreductase